jgi:hypothetical protein
MSRIINDRTYYEWIRDLLIYNWFWVIPTLLITYLYVASSYKEESERIDRIIKFLDVSKKRELISTTDGRVAVADRVKLIIDDNNTLLLPKEVAEVLKEHSDDIDLTIEGIREYLNER